MKNNKHTCVCCGHKVFDNLFDFEICPVCGWEDDPLQIRFPMGKRANKVPLVEAQVNLVKIGVLYEGFLNFADGKKYEIDPEWRMFDKKDKIETREEDTGETDYPNDMTKMYYWSDEYWLK